MHVHVPMGPFVTLLKLASQHFYGISAHSMTHFHVDEKDTKANLCFVCSSAAAAFNRARPTVVELF